MFETELNKVLNYMRQYVENVYEHDSEPMLNYKDLSMVLDYIDQLKRLAGKDYTELNILELKCFKYEKIINNLTNFLEEYHRHRDSFKWNEQDYIDVVDEIEKIVGGKE